MKNKHLGKSRKTNAIGEFKKNSKDKEAFHHIPIIHCIKHSTLILLISIFHFEDQRRDLQIHLLVISPEKLNGAYRNTCHYGRTICP
uniref:Bm13434 n=1 Tax=Brugia malayi TaxID=6279 RepID=A0A0J9XS81_BRUMA|nr:Bm13434 [Brugia malayi]